MSNFDAAPDTSALKQCEEIFTQLAAEGNKVEFDMDAGARSLIDALNAAQQAVFKKCFYISSSPSPARRTEEVRNAAYRDCTAVTDAILFYPNRLNAILGQRAAAGHDDPDQAQRQAIFEEIATLVETQKATLMDIICRLRCGDDALEYLCAATGPLLKPGMPMMPTFALTDKQRAQGFVRVLEAGGDSLAGESDPYHNFCIVRRVDADAGRTYWDVKRVDADGTPAKGRVNFAVTGYGNRFDRMPPGYPAGNFYPRDSAQWKELVRTEAQARLVPTCVSAAKYQSALYAVLGPGEVPADPSQGSWCDPRCSPVTMQAMRFFEAFNTMTHWVAAGCAGELTSGPSLLSDMLANRAVVPPVDQRMDRILKARGLIEPPTPAAVPFAKYFKPSQILGFLSRCEAGTGARKTKAMVYGKEGFAEEFIPSFKIESKVMPFTMPPDTITEMEEDMDSAPGADVPYVRAYYEAMLAARKLKAETPIRMYVSQPYMRSNPNLGVAGDPQEDTAIISMRPMDTLHPNGRRIFTLIARPSDYLVGKNHGVRVGAAHAAPPIALEMGTPVMGGATAHARVVRNRYGDAMKRAMMEAHEEDVHEQLSKMTRTD